MGTLVGVVSPAKMHDDTNPRRDEYYFGNNYGNRVYDLGGVPMGILPSDGYISKEVLDRFDSFLILGGHKTWPYHLQVVHHAVTTGKPLLGICLGMQSIHIYFRLLDYMEATGKKADIAQKDSGFFEIYQEFREKANPKLIMKVEGHLMTHVRGEEEATKQNVHLKPGSHIHRLLGQDIIRAGSFHKFAIQNPNERIAITGTADDGTIDVIEYGENILGVQFHPEIDRELMPIFSVLFPK